MRSRSARTGWSPPPTRRSRRSCRAPTSSRTEGCSTAPAWTRPSRRSTRERGRGDPGQPRPRALVLALRGEELLGRTVALARSARSGLAEVDGLVVPGDDPSKLVLALAGTGRTGSRWRATLDRGRALELANRDTLVPLLTMGDTEEASGASSACCAAPSSAAAASRARPGPRRPSGRSSPRWRSRPGRRSSRPARRSRPTAPPAGLRPSSSFRIRPGIPAIAPGELVEAELLETLREAAAGGTARVLRRRVTPHAPGRRQLRPGARAGLCYSAG